VRISVDGAEVLAHVGQSVLSAVLAVSGRLRVSEFDGGPRAGFCLMGACQDCWVWFADGGRGRACSTLVAEGMAVLTAPPAEPG
jgi:predicted molibdopterin-dependent oxidoreductase YjgC